MTNPTSNEHSRHSPVYVSDSVGRKYEAPCPWCLQDEVERLSTELSYWKGRCGVEPGDHTDQVSRSAVETKEPQILDSFEAGWRAAANWADRDDLIAERARSLAEDANTVGRQRPSKSHDVGSNPAGHAKHEYVDCPKGIGCPDCHGSVEETSHGPAGQIMQPAPTKATLDRPEAGGAATFDLAAEINRQLQVNGRTDGG